jgi:hypothetical protein
MAHRLAASDEQWTVAKKELEKKFTEDKAVSWANGTNWAQVGSPDKRCL